MNFETIITVLTALGGIEALKWAISTFTNRKTNKRKEEASVLSLEIENRQNIIETYEKRLNDRDKKVDSICIELRQEQSEKLELIKKNNSLELQLAEANIKKCVKRGCNEREPQSEY